MQSFRFALEIRDLWLSAQQQLGQLAKASSYMRAQEASSEELAAHHMQVHLHLDVRAHHARSALEMRAHDRALICFES